MSAPNIIGINDSDGSYIQPLPQEYLSGYVAPVKTPRELLKSKRNAPSGADSYYGIEGGDAPRYRKQVPQTNTLETQNPFTGEMYLKAEDYTGLPMARWNDIPYRARKGSFKTGIVAFHQSGIREVQFFINKDPNAGGPGTGPDHISYGMEYNEKSKTNEFVFIVDTLTLNAGLHWIAARVYSNAGTYIELMHGGAGLLPGVSAEFGTTTTNNPSFATESLGGVAGTYFITFKDLYNSTNITAPLNNPLGNYRGVWSKAKQYEIDDIVSVDNNESYYAIAKNAHFSEQNDFLELGGFIVPGQYHSAKNPNAPWELIRTKGGMNVLPFVVETLAAQSRDEIVYIDPVNGNDATGEVNNRTAPFKTITKLQGNPKVTEYRIMAEGVIEITRPVSDNNTLSGPKNNAYLLIQADPRQIADGTMKVQNVKLKLDRLGNGFYLFRHICFDDAVTGHNLITTHAWMDNCLFTTSVAGNAPVYNLWNSTQKYVTDCVNDRGFQPYGSCQLVRNSNSYYNIGDLFGNFGLVVNVRSKNLRYSLDENYTIHQDCIQLYNFCHNKIIYGLHSEDMDSQNILMNGGAMQEIAIVNFVADNATDETAGYHTGSLTVPYRNIFIAHTNILNKTNQFFRGADVEVGQYDPNVFKQETMTGNLVVNSIIPSTSAHPDVAGRSDYPRSLRFIRCILPNSFSRQPEWLGEKSFLTECVLDADNNSDYVYGTVSVVTTAATIAGGQTEIDIDHNDVASPSIITIDYEASGLNKIRDFDKRAFNIFGLMDLSSGTFNIGAFSLSSDAIWMGSRLREESPSVSLNKWSMNNHARAEIFPTNRICNVSNATFTQFRPTLSNTDTLPNPHTYSLTSYPTSVKMIDGRDNGNTFTNSLTITADTKGEFNEFFKNLKVYIPTSAAATAYGAPAKSIIRGLESLSTAAKIIPSGYLELGITSTTQPIIVYLRKNVAGFAGISAMEDHISQFPTPGLHDFGRVSGLPTSYGESAYGYDYNIIMDGITTNDYLPTEGLDLANAELSNLYNVVRDFNRNPRHEWDWMGAADARYFENATTLTGRRLKRLSNAGPAPADVYGFYPRVVSGMTGDTGKIPYHFDQNGNYFAGLLPGATLGITFDASSSSYRWMFTYKFKNDADTDANWVYLSEEEYQRSNTDIDAYLNPVHLHWKNLNKYRILTSRKKATNPDYAWVGSNYMDVDFGVGELPRADIDLVANFPYITPASYLTRDNIATNIVGEIQTVNWTMNNVSVSQGTEYTIPPFENDTKVKRFDLKLFMTNGYTSEGITLNNTTPVYVLPKDTIGFYVSGSETVVGRAAFSLVNQTHTDQEAQLISKAWENESYIHWMNSQKVTNIKIKNDGLTGNVILTFGSTLESKAFKDTNIAGISASNFKFTIMNASYPESLIPGYFSSIYTATTGATFRNRIEIVNPPSGITFPQAREYYLKRKIGDSYTTADQTYEIYEGITAQRTNIYGNTNNAFDLAKAQWFTFKNPSGPLQFANRSLQTCTTTKYISPGLLGSDLNSGDSISAPYKTMTKAMAQSQKDGCIFCGPGVYNIEQGAGYTRSSGKIIGMIGFAGVTSGLKIMSYDESDPAKFKGSIGHNLLPLSGVSLEQINPAYSGSVRGFTLNDKLKSATEYGLAGRDFRDRVQNIYLFESKSNEIQPISSEGIPTSPSIIHFGAARAENPTLPVNEWKTTFDHWFPAINTINNANTGQIYQWYSGFSGAYLGATYTAVCYGISGATQNNFIYNLIKEKTPSPYWESSSAATSFWKDTTMYFHGGPNNAVYDSKIVGVDIDATKVYVYHLTVPEYGFPAGLSMPIQGQTMFRHSLTQQMTVANHPYWLNFPGQYTLRGNTGMYMPVNILPGASGQISIAYYDNIIVLNNSDRTTISNLHMGECVAWGMDSNTSGNNQRGLTLTGNAIQDCGYGGMSISITNEPSRNLPNLPTMINRNYVTRTQYRPISIVNTPGATLQPMVRAEWNTVYNWFEYTGLYSQGVSGGIFKGNTVVSHANAVHGNGMAFYVNSRNLVIDSNFVYMPKNLTVAINDVYGNDAGNNKWEIKNNVCIGQAFEWRDKFVCGACFTNNIVSSLVLYQVDVNSEGPYESAIAERTYWKEICTRRVIRNNIIGAMNNGFYAPVNGTGGTYSPMWWARATGGDNQYIFRDNLIGNVESSLMNEYVLNNNGIPTYGPYGENKALCQENNIGVMQFINGNTTSGITLFFKGLLADVNTDIHSIDVSTNIFGYANNNESFFPSSTAKIFRGDNGVPPMRTTQQGIGLDYSATTSRRWRTYADRYAGLNYEYDEEGNVVNLPETHIWDWTLRQENTALIPAINFGSINSTEDTHGVYVNDINMLDGATMAWPSDKISARAKMYINNETIGTTLTHEIGLFKWTNGTNNYTAIDGSDYTYPILDPTLMNIGSYKNMGGRKIYSVASVPSYPSIPVSTVGPITYHPYNFGDMIFINTYTGLSPGARIDCVNQFNGGVNMHGDYGQYLSKTHWLTKYPEYRTGALNGSLSTGTNIQQTSSPTGKNQTLTFVFVPGVGESIFECNSKATLFKNRLNSGNWETPAWSSIGITGGLRLVIHSGFDFEQYKNSDGVTITVAPTYPLIFKNIEGFTLGEVNSPTKRTVIAKIKNIDRPSSWYIQGGSSISHPDFRITMVPGLTGPIVTGTKTQASSIPTSAPTVESIAKNQSRLTDTNDG